jgi:hypothetical protein
VSSSSLEGIDGIRGTTMKGKAESWKRLDMLSIAAASYSEAKNWGSTIVSVPHKTLSICFSTVSCSECLSKSSLLGRVLASARIHF